MEGSTYKIVEIIGTSDTSWEDAVKNAIETAEVNLRDMRISEVSKLDVTVRDGKVTSYRVRLKVSFKYHKLIKKIKTQDRPEDLFTDRIKS
jgi:flavin-binding protein dodecin